MSQFEFLSVAVSIVFALSVGKQIAAIPEVFSKKSWDWLYVGYFLGLLFMQIQFWWRMWPLSTVESWDFLGFTLVLFIPLFYYLASHTLVSQSPSQVTSWSEHFSKVHMWFHGAICFAWLNGGMMAFYLLDFNFSPPFFITVVLFAIAVFLNRRWFHAVVLVWWWFILSIIAYGLTRRSRLTCS